MVSKEKLTIEKLNKDYFQSLIHTRISLKNTSFYFASLVVGMLMLSMYWLIVKEYGIEVSQTTLGRSLLVSVGFMILFILFLVLPPLKKVVFRHQAIAAFFQNIFVLLLIFVLSLLMIFISSVTASGFALDRMAMLGWVFIIVYALGLFYNIFWLKGQLNIGFSAERTQMNFLDKPAVKSVGSMAIIFIGSLAGKWATAGQANILGIGGGVFLLIVFSRLTVELFYATMLKWRDKEYWEEYRTEDGAPFSKSKRLSVLRFGIELTLVLIIGYLRLEVLPKDSSYISALKLFPKLVLVYWGVRLVIWGYRKLKNRKDNT